jgi:hypothetical protein
MGGGILWRMLTKTNGALDAVHARMKIRHIHMSKDQEDRWTIGDKRKKLRLHEMSRLCGDGTGKATMGMKESDVAYLVPLSDEMKDFMTQPPTNRDRPRDSSSLGGSPGYQRYQKISRMLRQVCESQFFCLNLCLALPQRALNGNY